MGFHQGALTAGTWFFVSLFTVGCATEPLTPIELAESNQMSANCEQAGGRPTYDYREKFHKCVTPAMLARSDEMERACIAAGRTVLRERHTDLYRDCKAPVSVPEPLQPAEMMQIPQVTTPTSVSCTTIGNTTTCN